MGDKGARQRVPAGLRQARRNSERLRVDHRRRNKLRGAARECAGLVEDDGIDEA